jgi:prolyl oligopeptidase
LTEYSSVKDRDRFRVFYSYSPYHQVVNGARYPSILLEPRGNNPRVEPRHAQGFCARLQAANASPNPIPLHTTDKAGHGIRSSLDEIIANQADI